MKRFIRVKVTAEWGDLHETLGAIQANESSGELHAMPATKGELCRLIMRLSEELGLHVATVVEHREDTARDVLQPKNYGPRK